MRAREARNREKPGGEDGRPALILTVGDVALEAARFWTSAAKRAEEQHRREADEVERAPTVRQHVHEREEAGGESDAGRAEGTEHPDAPAAVLGRKLLGHDHERQRESHRHERPRHHLDHDELRDRLRERREPGTDRHHDDRHQEEPAPPQAVGEWKDEQRGDGAEADQGKGIAELSVVEPEIGRDARERGAEHPEVVLVEEEAERHHAEHPEMLRRHVGDGAEERRDPPGAARPPCAGRHVCGLMRASACRTERGTSGDIAIRQVRTFFSSTEAK